VQIVRVKGLFVAISPGFLRYLIPGCLLGAALAIAGCGHHRPVVSPPAATPVPGAPPANPSSQAPPSPTPPPKMRGSTAVPAEFTEQGVASWYGEPFNGRRTSDGEIYNMFQYTAAHRTLPFGAVVRVTNLNNGKQTVVRINDRGPFVANRIIDLSYSAAVAIGMIGTGTAPVRLDLVGGPNPNIGFFGVQVGAFQVEENAQRFRERLAAAYSPVTIETYDSPNGVFYRVRVGRFTNEDQARQLAAELQEQEQITALVVRLDN
jgi:peptidoglycan lytic transglycosylase